MITTAIAALGGAAFGAIEWRIIARRHTNVTMESALQHARHVIAVVPVALALLAIQILIITHPDVMWSAPVWLEIHHVRLLFGAIAACISFVFGLAAYGAFSTRDRKGPGAIVCGTVVLAIILFIERDFTAPIWSDLHERMDGDVVLQSTGASCAAASAANLARHYGVVHTEPEMAALLGTTRFGTRLLVSPAHLAERWKGHTGWRGRGKP